MPAYIGTLSNKGKVFENDAEALAYAFEKCGIEPLDDWVFVDEEFCEMILEWFYSKGDWIICCERNGYGLSEPGFPDCRD